MVINEIKFRLNKFFRIDRNLYKPLRVLEDRGKYYLIFAKRRAPKEYLYTWSLDGWDFSIADEPKEYPLVEKEVNWVIVNGYHLHNKKIMYWSDRHIYLAELGKKPPWKIHKKPVILSAYPTEAAGAFLFPKGIIMLYYKKSNKNGILQYKAHLAEFDKSHPDKLLWHTDKPVWDSKTQFGSRKATPLGAVKIADKIVMYWYVDDAIIYGINLSGFVYDPTSIKQKAPPLKRYSQNPIISPRSANQWESFTTLNPAAAHIDNKIHIFYRAQGYDYISTVGYATSLDGLTINQRSDEPIYSPRADFETNNTGSVNKDLMSAGGWGGVEDPRVTVLNGRLYMVYVAFDGWANVRLALTSIAVDDFLKQRWNWEKPILISPPHVIDKSGCLLPEKIGGRYVFFHRIFPNIYIDYVDDLNFKKNQWLKGRYRIKVRPDKWDSRKIGAGAPPIKTADGWLLIYYGVDDRDASKYHIGAMLLDINDPAKVLYRSDSPILSPEAEYEMNGFKPGIAYPCGAVVVKDDLLVYYGAADSVVCVARANLNHFLSDLKSSKSPHLEMIQIKEVQY